MKDLFVPYELAVLAKEKGFKDMCFYYFNKRGELILDRTYLYEYHSIGEYHTLAPLYQQLVDWFREEHKIQIEILWRGDMSTFCYKLGKFKYGSHDFSKQDWGFKEYYKAFNEALTEGFKLI